MPYSMPFFLIAPRYTYPVLKHACRMLIINVIIINTVVNTTAVCIKTIEGTVDIIVVMHFLFSTRLNPICSSYMT